MIMVGQKEKICCETRNPANPRIIGNGDIHVFQSHADKKCDITPIGKKGDE